MAMIMLAIDTAHLNELCMVAAEATVHARQGRVRLGLALQGAITQALAPGAPVAAPGGAQPPPYQPLGVPGGWMVAQPVAVGGMMGWRAVRVRYANGRLGPDVYQDMAQCERDCARLNKRHAMAEDQGTL